ncbi:MAG: tRNA-dihydrouridine synthase family protein [Planctomycetes bacterium]|nr:tRNA-dihydrouridine synthase family protein [Planctomycetota bacterium]MBU2457267.1 tRNA-dihydrouridine synthase family protein [Planctomycetota bacterium]
MLKIGNIKLNTPIMQSPLSGYSDRAMRTLARQFGCELTFSGVMLDTSACHKPLLKRNLYKLRKEEHPIGGQLLGTEPKTMAQAAHNFCDMGYDIIDLNFACPAPKVLRRGRGGAMLDNPAKILEIFCAVKNAVKCPVMMKLRIGVDESEGSRENFFRICNDAVAEGVDGLIVHGRTTSQYFRGSADWGIIAELKKLYPQTVIIGSGDLFDAKDIVNKLETSGADGAAVARGAIGKPWIFRQIKEVLEGKEEIYQPNIIEQGQIILEHFSLLKELYEPKKCVWYFRKFLSQYGRSHGQSGKVRRELVTAKDEAKLIETIKKWYGV